MEDRKTVLVVDDHPLFRRAMVSLMEDLNCEVLSATSAEEGAQKARDHHVNLVLLDLGLPGAAGVDAVNLIRRGSDAAIVAVSGSENRPEVAAVGRAGASAVVSKGVSMDTLRETIQHALAGTLSGPRWLRPMGTLPIADEKVQGFTSRQHQIAMLLLDGHSNKEIGMRLGLAEITVKTHLTAIFRTLGVVNRTQAVVEMRKLGIEAAQRGSHPQQA